MIELFEDKASNIKLLDPIGDRRNVFNTGFHFNGVKWKSEKFSNQRNHKIIICNSILWVGLLIILMTSSTFGATHSQSILNQMNNDTKETHLPSSHVRMDQYDDPIAIDGNSNFLSAKSTKGWSGTGTLNDPIIITGLNMSSDIVTLVSIKNTDLCFHIENSYFITHLTNQIGLQIINASNFQLINDHFVGFYTSTTTSNDIGLLLDTVSNVVIKSSTFEKLYYPITINNLDGIQIIDSTFYDAPQGFVIPATSQTATIQNNLFRKIDGLAISMIGNNSEISGNTFETVRYAIGVGDSYPKAILSVISNNLFNYTYQEALTVGNIKQATVSLNTFLNCDIAIVSSHSQKALISDNTVKESDNGIKLDSTTATLTNNILINSTFVLIATKLSDVDNLVFSGNTVNGKAVLFAKNVDTANYQGYGQIMLFNSKNVDIHNMYGTVEVWWSTHINIHDVQSNVRSNGIVIHNSNFSSIYNNEITWGKSYGVGIGVDSSFNISIYSNIINSGLEVFIEGIVTSYSTNITISDNHISRIGSFSIYAVYSTNIFIMNNNINESSRLRDGIALSYTNQSKINQNIVNSLPSNPIYLSSAISIDYSYFNEIHENIIYSSSKGVDLTNSHNNSISGNLIMNLKSYALYFSYSSNNTITDNNFIFNNEGAYSQGFDEYDLGFVNNYTANYWQDLTLKATDGNGDGYLDTNYLLNGQSMASDTLPRSMIFKNIDYLTPVYPNTTSFIVSRYKYQFEISWNRSIDTFGHDVFYNLYYRKGDTSWISIAKDLNTNHTLFVVKDLVDGSDYQLKIEAIDHHDHKIATVVRMAVFQPPSPPEITSLTYTADENQVAVTHLTWKMPTKDETSLRNVYVYRNSTKDPLLTSVLLSAVTYDSNGNAIQNSFEEVLEGGDTYTYYVSLENYNGEGFLSQPAEIVIPVLTNQVGRTTVNNNSNNEVRVAFLDGNNTVTILGFVTIPVILRKIRKYELK